MTFASPSTTWACHQVNAVCHTCFFLRDICHCKYSVPFHRRRLVTTSCTYRVRNTYNCSFDGERVCYSIGHGQQRTETRPPYRVNPLVVYTPSITRTKCVEAVRWLTSPVFIATAVIGAVRAATTRAALDNGGRARARNVATGL